MTQATDLPRAQRAVHAACRAAEAQGLSFDTAVVLRDLSNVVVQLRGSPVVARVATTTAEIRQGDGWLARELAVARHLANAGAPVVPPSSRVAPGPHHEDGLVLTFWEWIDELDEPPDPHAAGQALRTCHEALCDFEGELPRWGAWHEALRVQERVEQQALLADADLATLQRVAQRLSASLEGLELPLEAVHGDAGPSNALNTSAGVLWTDWEDTFLGPRAWDLACLVSSTRIVRPEATWSELALASYGPHSDDESLDLLIEARAFLVTVWMAVIGQRHPSVLASLEARMKWFREREDPR